MSASRSFASLSSTLLARKGGARPAMRPQLAGPGGPSAAPAVVAADDLGWNDMGWDSHGDSPGDAGLASAAASLGTEPEPLLATKPVLAEVVPLVREAPLPAAVLASGLGRPVIKRTRPAAFTLRLEPDRHFRLRLACARQGRSAQSLVTEALDRFLAELPAVEPRSEAAPVQRTA